MEAKPGNKERLWGIQTRVSWTFFLFIVLMVALLWLMQIQLLDQFYRYEKRRTLQNVSANIAGNIDNTSLNTLIERVAEDNGLCVLIVDENMQTVYSADTAFSCIIHHLNHRDLRRMAQKLETDGQNFVFFPMQRTRSSGFDRQRFAFPAPLPMSDDGAEYLVSVQRARLEDGSEYYVLLNTLVTPVTATVQTIRSELWVLTTALLLIGFLLSSILSRRISRPIIQTTEAARALSQGEFTPIRDANAYREIAQLNRQLAQAAEMVDYFAVVVVGVHIKAVPDVAQQHGTAETEVLELLDIVVAHAAQGHHFAVDDFAFGILFQLVLREMRWVFVLGYAVENGR